MHGLTVTNGKVIFSVGIVGVKLITVDLTYSISKNKQVLNIHAVIDSIIGETESYDDILKINLDLP